MNSSSDCHNCLAQTLEQLDDSHLQLVSALGDLSKDDLEIVIPHQLSEDGPGTERGALLGEVWNVGAIIDAFRLQLRDPSKAIISDNLLVPDRPRYVNTLCLSITWIQQTKVALDVQLKALSEDQLSRTYVVAGGIGLSLKQSLIALADIHVQCKARVTEFDTIVKDIC